MGGVLILFSIAADTLLWFDLSNRLSGLWLLSRWALVPLAWVGRLRKVVNKDPEGMPLRVRSIFPAQSVIWPGWLRLSGVCIREQLMPGVCAVHIWVQLRLFHRSAAQGGPDGAFLRKSAIRGLCWLMS